MLAGCQRDWSQPIRLPPKGEGRAKLHSTTIVGAGAALHAQEVIHCDGTGMKPMVPRGMIAVSWMSKRLVPAFQMTT